jgi:Zinc-finger of C2H2 type/Zinc finger, C2H2 type
VRTLTEALPKLVPANLQRQPRQKMDLPTTADFAVMNTPPPVKQQATKGGVELAKVDVGLQPIKSILPEPPYRTVRPQTPDKVKSKNQEKSATVVEPQPEEFLLSNVETVSQKRKAEGGESLGASKKLKWGRSEHTNKCKFCNEFETHYMYSLTRHVRLKHPKVYKCKECMQNFEIGPCDRHLLKIKARTEKARKDALKIKTEDLIKSRKDTLGKLELDTLKKSRNDTLEKLKMEKSRNDTLEKLKIEKREKLRNAALEMQMNCPGCNIALVGASKLKAHANSCIKLSEEQIYTIKKSSVIQLAKTDFKARCKICKKSFYDRFTLARHEKSIHQKSGVYSCDQCSYTSASLTNLRAHIIRKHEKVDPHKVRMLKKIYKPVKNNSKRLFGEISGGKADEKELECQFCYSSFANLESMELHCLKMHPTSFRFVCRLCPEKKRFMFQASLDKHIESAHAQSGFHHLGEETTSSPDSGPFVSNDHSYASPTDKKSEELLHSEDTNSDVEWGKMSKCESCDKMFADEVTKKIHFRVFHERKSDPLPCIICNQIFASKVVLKIHLANCRGPKKQKVRPSEDGNTSTTTTTVKSPDDDKGSVIPKTIFTCSICKVPFDNLTDHNLHLVNVHSSKLTPERSGATSTESLEASASAKSAKRKIKLIVYRCNQCTEVFVSKDSVLKHLQSKHGASHVVFRSENRL